MSVGAHLIHRCDVKRATAPNADAYKANRRVFATVATDEACRLVEKQQRVVDVATGERAVVTTYTMLFGPNVDVKAGDQITNIVDELGETMTNAAGTAAIYRIESLLMRRGRAIRHKSAVLERVG